MRVAEVELSGASVIVIGLARSGIAAMNLLAGQGARVTACDVKPLEEIDGASALVSEIGARFVLQDAAACAGHDLVVISPGVAVDAEPLEQARAAGIPVVGGSSWRAIFEKGRGDHGVER
jgi:UDP-N-acetylmuramoylalanine--D-glutamate ligase